MPDGTKKTCYDPFNAIAEPNGRALIETLMGNELTVNALADVLAWNQPKVSKHLAVLKEVGLVSERREGRFRVYRVIAEALKPIQLWINQFEKFWESRLDQLDQYLKDIQNRESNDD